jgi:hypothetical protein
MTKSRPGRVFQTAVALIENNPELNAEADPYADHIRMNNGTDITPISGDFKGAAGSRHSLVIYDEIWGFESEKARRLYEELTPPPSEFSAWALIVTYAGFLGEADLLESIYQRGIAGRRIDDELECYESDELFMFWSHTPRQPGRPKPTTSSNERFCGRHSLRLAQKRVGIVRITVYRPVAMGPERQHHDSPRSTGGLLSGWMLQSNTTPPRLSPSCTSVWRSACLAAHKIWCRARAIDGL